MIGLIGLDFETYSAVDLPKHGAPRYFSDVTFLPLTAGLAVKESDGTYWTNSIDLFGRSKGAVEKLRHHIDSKQIVAHNAPFEQGVLNWLGLDYPSSRFIDSAVVASVAGAGRKLEAAAPQLLGVDKMESGKDLMKIFSMPGKYQAESGSMHFDRQIIGDHLTEWAEYEKYCRLDAELGLRIVDDYLSRCTGEEMGYQMVTMEMNQRGWPVDIEKVEEMQRRYLENQEIALFQFRINNDAKDLNLNSSKQLKAWCGDRGIKAKSFDEEHVARMHAAIEKKWMLMSADDPKFVGYQQVLALLETKQILGGSSLKKLQVILDTAIPDTWNPGGHRLKDQYLHCGAGQSLRTTGRSVQMQNLKRLSVVADMTELEDPDSEWDNIRLAENLRQVFTSRNRQGRLIVGDLSAIDSRCLAWLAGEEWKLDAYRKGVPVYESLAGRFYGKHFKDVTVEERTFGKTGELSCGYGAGSEAVQSFASKMGVTMSEAQAAKLVWDWRDADPATVGFWEILNDALHYVVHPAGTGFFTHRLKDQMTLAIQRIEAPTTMKVQHPGSVSVIMSIMDPQGRHILKRYFHGCHVMGRNIRYYKPSDRKTGDLWKAGYVDPKTKLYRHYELYGGKLAGILTQSLAREIFMAIMLWVHKWAQGVGNQIDLIGQFHDELVLDWVPGFMQLELATVSLHNMMAKDARFPSLPMDATVKVGYRYIK